MDQSDPKTPYDALLAAARSLVDTHVLAAYLTAPDSAVRAYLSANSAHLSAARGALAAGCQIPLRYDASFFGEHMEAMAPLRNLSQSFALELRQAAADGDYAAAARIGVNLLDLANAWRRGGLVIDFLVAVAVVSIAVDLLRQVREQLGTADRLTLIQQLVRTEHDQEPLPEIVARDRRWESTVGWNQEEKVDLTRQPLPEPAPAEGGLTKDQRRLQRFSAKPDDARQSVYVNQDRRTIALLRMLAVDLALRSWRAENGAYPDGLDPVAPMFSAGVPDDPFTQKPFCYRRVSDDFVLYSPGPTGIDHAGHSAPGGRCLAGPRTCVSIFGDYGLGSKGN
jgi:hypothetical protein